MHTPTYKEQFDKLTRAYINDTLCPTNCCSCFIGNMFNQTGDWYRYGNSLDGIKNRNLLEREILINASGLYTPEEIILLERTFVETFSRHCSNPFNDNDALFIALNVALDLLNQIHIAHGEVIDEAPVFTKRKPQTV